MISYNSIGNQPTRRPECITIGRMAPDFIANSTHGIIRLSDYRGKWVLIASQPMAFTAVATTELISAAQSYPEFLKRNAVIIGLTTDNVYANLAWVYEIYQQTGITIPFPIIADANLDVSELYGMLNPDRLYEETVRDAFFINPYGRIAAIITLPISTGRSIPDLIKIIESLQLTENQELHTPANWRPGDPYVLKPSPGTYEGLMDRVNEGENQGLYCPFWYLCYTNMNNPQTDTPNTPPQIEMNNG